MRLEAYHSSQSEKDKIMAQLARHRKSDDLVKGRYWHEGNYIEHQERLGIPVMLAQLGDCIFQNLHNKKEKEWPELLMGSIEPGQDLSLVGWNFLHWFLTDETVNPGINHELVKEAITQCASAIYPLTKGYALDVGSAYRAKIAVESAAESAAEAVTWTAGREWRAKKSAVSATWIAKSALSTDSDLIAAESACATIGSSRAAFELMSEKLIQLIKETA